MVRGERLPDSSPAVVNGIRRNLAGGGGGSRVDGASSVLEAEMK
jgi:hypothetical protein